MRFYVKQVSESHENVVVPDVDVVVINATPTAQCIRQRDSLVAHWNKTTNVEIILHFEIVGNTIIIKVGKLYVIYS